jgi:hypothetical protein
MNKILLALAILGVGACGFLTARNLTTQLAHEANANHESWLVQTQQLAAFQREQADLAVRLRGLKESLAQSQPVAENALWSMLQTNRADKLPPELRERVLEELGFNWQSSADFIVVTKQTVRDTGYAWPMLRHGKLSEVAATILAMTPAERGQVEAGIQRAQSDYKDWAVAKVERREPKNGNLADYFLPGDPAMEQGISADIAAGILAALGKERAKIMQNSVSSWRQDSIGLGKEGATLFIRRELVGNEQRLKAEISGPELIVHWGYHPAPYSGYYPEFDLPETFRPIFPNGWADVAKREGFELPQESSEK